MLIPAVEQQARIINDISSCIEDSRNHLLIYHIYTEMITQRVCQISAGYEDADDCDSDSVLKMCSGRTPEADSLSSQPTMTHLENKVSTRELYLIGNSFVKNFISSYQKEPESIILDCDDSNVNTYGQQQLTLFNAYYGECCYIPLFIFEGISSKMILPVLRPGRSNKNLNVYRLLRRLIDELRQYWKNTKFILRGDLHFASHEFMDWANERNNIYFITGLGNSVLLNRVSEWVDKARKPFNQHKIPVNLQRTFRYKSGSWKHEQRVVSKIEVNEQGINIRFVVTNFINNSSRFIYEGIFCDRGRQELMIKELKTYLYAHRIS